MFAVPATVHAQSRGASYLPAFPDGDSYNLMVIGDDFSYGLRHGLEDALRNRPRVNIQPRPLHFDGVLRVNVGNEVKRIESAIDESKISIAVMMVGARDAVSIRDKNGKRFRVGTDVWNQEYTRRVDALMAMFKRKTIAVYWVGLPVTSNYNRNEEFRQLNGILRERAFRNGIKFVDVYAGFGDAQERFSAYGPDLQGETRLLRSRDGLYFTDAGNRKLAHFVYRKLRSDLKQAQEDRQIPLAGSAAEQARINVSRRSEAPQVSAEQIGGNKNENARSAESTPSEPSPLGEQEADHGKISLRLRKSNGEQETVVLDILRPRIPESVVSLVTRRAARNKRADVGDTLLDNIPNGITVMSSITPSAASAAGRRQMLSPTQTPFFRVMVRGEPLPAVPGRVDDFRWSDAKTQKFSN